MDHSRSPYQHLVGEGTELGTGMACRSGLAPGKARSSRLPHCHGAALLWGLPQCPLLAGVAPPEYRWWVSRVALLLGLQELLEEIAERTGVCLKLVSLFELLYKFLASSLNERFRERNPGKKPLWVSQWQSQEQQPVVLTPSSAVSPCLLPSQGAAEGGSIGAG